VAIAGAVAVGMLTALQARINGQLGLHLGDGFVAAVVSFGSGLVALVALSAAVPSGRRGARALASGIRHRTIPWWMLAEGRGGAHGRHSGPRRRRHRRLAVHRRRRGGADPFRAPPRSRRLRSGRRRRGDDPARRGGALALVAVAISLQGGVLERVPWWMLVLPFLAGIGIAWQQATNGRLRQRVGTR
jgi:transporter family-2 protein